MAKKRSKKKQQFALQPWMFVALAAIVIAVIAGLALASQSGDDGDNGSYTTISVQEAYEQTNADADAVFVDIREPFEWEEFGVPEGSMLISTGNIMSVPSGEVDGLPQDQPIYIICNSGNRSIEVSNHLIDLGYDDVFNVVGGIQAWITAGLPTTAYTQ
ncbi:MAG: rhodanese-like domain-containing protein [Anaerolineae bacterium]|nr:rhodanese-like domain-containing protein [Anaerolineae bacterium]